MERPAQIALFYVGLWIFLRLLRRRPNSWASRLAFSWQGPFPVEGERRSAFLWRQALYAGGWLVQIVFAGALVVLAATLFPGVRESEAFALVTAFALAIGAGMAVVSGTYFALASFKASVVGPDPEFVVVRPEEPDDDDDEPEQHEPR